MADTEKPSSNSEVEQVDLDFYQYIFQYHPLPAWIYDRETLQFLAVNQAAVTDYGYSEAEFLSMRITDIRTEQDQKKLLEFLSGPVGSHEATGPWRHKLADGSLREVSAYSRDLVFRGIPARLLIVNDVSERKQLEQKLRLFAAAVAGATEGVMITEGKLDQPGPRIVFVNDAFCKMTGYAAEELIGRQPSVFQGPKTERIAVAKIRKDLETSGTATYKSVNYRRDHTEYLVEWEVSPLLDDSGTITHYLSLQRDVTERNRLEEQFQQAQKMEAVGRLAGGIAHDFNNILTIILGYAGLLSVELVKDSIVEERQLRGLQEIQKAAEKAAVLTGQLLAFSRKQVLRTRVLDLNSVVSNLESMLCRIIGEDVTLGMALHPNPACVRTDAGQVESVLMNLAVNARDAMPKGGVLTISTGHVEITPRFASRTPVAPGNYVLLSVTDTGHGMDEATRSRIFEPFFTTKETGRGTGLGLSMVYGFVKQNEGHVEAVSEPGHGTTMNIYLPCADDCAEAETVRGPATDVHCTGTILVVEDEAGIREVMHEVLTASGYQVYTAANAREANDFSSLYNGVIDVLISDVVLPGTSGPELAAQLKSARPNLRVLFSSGYSDHALLQKGELEQSSAFVQKPFDTDTLINAIQKLLSAKASNKQAG